MNKNEWIENILILITSKISFIQLPKNLFTVFKNIFYRQSEMSLVILIKIVDVAQGTIRSISQFLSVISTWYRSLNNGPTN